MGDTLTYEELRDIQDTLCRDCKGGPYFFDSDCRNFCDAFKAAAKEIKETARDE